MRVTWCSIAGIALMLGSVPVSAASREKADADMNRIIDEGFNHSQIEETMVSLADLIGSRLTNSPGMRKAEDWTVHDFA